MTKIWQLSGNSFFYNDKNTEVNELAVGVYLLKEYKFGLYLMIKSKKRLFYLLSCMT